MTDIILFAIMILLLVLCVLGFKLLAVASAIVDEQDDIKHSVYEIDGDVDELWNVVFSPDDDPPDEEDVDETSNVVAFGRKPGKAA